MLGALLVLAHVWGGSQAIRALLLLACMPGALLCFRLCASKPCKEFPGGACAAPPNLLHHTTSSH